MRVFGAVQHIFPACLLLVFFSVGLGGAEEQLPESSPRELKPGDVLGPDNWQLARDLLPPEILRHYEKGEYVSPIMEWRVGSFRRSDEFMAATKENANNLALDEKTGNVIDRRTGKQPPYIYGSPFPRIDRNDPQAGIKILWNYFYGLWSNGNSRNIVDLVWLSLDGIDRSAGQDVYFLFYDGQSRDFRPPNPNNLYMQFLATTTHPQDLHGTTALTWRYRDAGKRDSNWVYVPSLRRVRAVSPANRSDGFLGSDMSQDDGQFFDGKPQDFEWKLVGEQEALCFTDPYRLKGGSTDIPLPGGGWRTVYKPWPWIGYQDRNWKGVAWAPVGMALVKRPVWIIEATPKDKYYLYGKIQLYIDKETFGGAWNRKFSWKGELLNTLQVPHGPASTPDGVHYFDQGPGGGVVAQLAESIKLNRATVATFDPTGQPPADRGIPLDPGFFDYENLMRFGK